AGAELGDWAPAVDGEEGMRARGAELAPEPRRDLVDRPDAVVDEARRLGGDEAPSIVEREEPPRALAEDVLDGPDAAVGEEDLRVGREALPHARPPRDDDQVGGLEPRRDAVEVGEAGGHAGDRLLLLVE